MTVKWKISHPELLGTLRTSSSVNMTVLFQNQVV